MTTDLLANLNPQQQAAVTAPPGPVLVLAGPGSGKTGVLTRRIAFLIREMGVKPWHIMAVTFTNKAAAEMRRRVSQYVQDERLHGFQIGTFHSTCARILRQEADYTPYRRDFAIYDTDDQLNVVGQALQDLDLDAKKHSPRSILSEISRAKNEMILPQEYRGSDYFTEIVGRVYRRYQQLLEQSNALDFDDLLTQMVLALRGSAMLREQIQARYAFVLVDEFQDTNSVQYQLVQLIGAPQNNIFVVGDEDQSIYAFRGADYRNVLRFRRDYPAAQVILLEQNYRSTQIILDAARAVIDRNTNRTVKNLFTDRKGGPRLTVHEAYDDEYEARYVLEQIETLRLRDQYRYSDIAVIYRTNGQSRALEDAFIRNTIPYNIVGDVSFYKRREIKDVLAYMRLVNNPDDRVSFERIVNVPRRGIGEKSLRDFFNWLETQGYTLGAGLEHLRAGGDSPLSARLSRPLAEFATAFAQWQEKAQPGSLLALFDSIVGDIRYRFYLREIADTPQDAQNREDNLDALRATLQRADEAGMTLTDYVTESALMQDAAETRETGGDRVTLMTLHAAKGLEFPAVFITGLEEGILPHFRSLEEEGGLEEERRLLYVGMTRARERLFLTYAFRRALYGSASSNDRSRFLLDIPTDLMDNPPATFGTDRGAMRYGEMTRWDSGQGGLNRLKNDLARAAQGETSRHPHIAGKIMPFPGAKPRENAPTRFRVGMKVFQEKFGQGKVIASKLEDGDEIVTVVFSAPHGIKQLSAEYGRLTILE
jgi:DNA helicase-2/ATP-dependent DNA helicase PcrA